MNRVCTAVTSKLSYNVCTLPLIYSDKNNCGYLVLKLIVRYYIVHLYINVPMGLCTKQYIVPSCTCINWHDMYTLSKKIHSGGG